MADIIKFPDKKENLNAVVTLLGVCRKMHDEDGYRYASIELKQEDERRAALTLVLEKPQPDDIPDIIA